MISLLKLYSNFFVIFNSIKQLSKLSNPGTTVLGHNTTHYRSGHECVSDYASPFPTEGPVAW